MARLLARRWPGRAGSLMALWLAVAVAGVTACADFDQADAAAVADEGLIAETADRVAAADGQSWTATYRLAGGQAARVTRGQKPSRIAYTFPAGLMIITSDTVIRCDRDAEEMKCINSNRRDGEEGPPASAGLIAPAAILDMLEVAAIDPDLAVTPRETTIAGRHASCLRLAGVDQSAASTFEVCVTVEGAVAAFSGTVAGSPVEMTLTDYHAGIDESDFATPPESAPEPGVPSGTPPPDAAPAPSR